MNETAVGKKRPRSPPAALVDDSTDRNGQQQQQEAFSVTWSNNNSDAVVTVPTAGLLLCIQGTCLVKCYQGRLELLGTSIDPTTTTAQHLDSPPWTAWSTVTTMESQTVFLLQSVPLGTNNTNTNNDSATTNTTAEGGTNDTPPSVPTFAIYSANQCKATGNNNGKPATTVQPTIVPPSWIMAVADILEDLKVHQAEAVAESMSAAVEDAHAALFQETAATTAAEDTTAKANFCTVVAGAKGVGKSTCVRYTVNRLLTQTKAVALLNADPGQPELSAPGVLSLTIVTEPLLHQPYNLYQNSSNNTLFAHERAYYFGANTSQTDPVRFLECVAALVQSYQDLVGAATTTSVPNSDASSSISNNKDDDDENPTTTTMPLVVNLDGWVKGLGNQVLQAVMQQLQPRHVLQIVGDLKSKVFDLASSLETISANSVLHVLYAYNSTQETAPATDGYYGPLSVAPVVPATAPVQTFSMSASNLRAHRLATYFCGRDVWEHVGFGQNGIDDPVCEIAQRLAAMRPHVVPWEAVDWQHFALPDYSGEIVSPAAILSALNGSVVGLCKRQGNDENENHLLPCVGLGLVRAIDRTRQLFYILTPVAPELLMTVNVLSRGVISLPAAFYFRGVGSECFPYQANAVSTQLDLLGADPMKSRNSIARRGGGGGGGGN